MAIDEWINPIYLNDRVVDDIKESIVAKPIVKYAVLDNFFNPRKINELIRKHKSLSFSEKADRVSNGNVLPYDGSVKFADKDDYGSDLFFDSEWHRYCAYITSTILSDPAGTEVKLRYHRGMADGFWIHTDSTIRDLVIIAYFNRGWKAKDGGLLQLWRMEEDRYDKAFKVNLPSGRMDFLNLHKRINTRTPGGGFPDDKDHDLVLIDQIVPVYNRVFICNFKDEPAYHSVTPSNGKPRIGFVQWLFDTNNGKRRDHKTPSAGK
jgi:hypothetical protein